MSGSKPQVVDDGVITLTENNHVLLRGGVDEQSVAKVMEGLSAVLEKRKNVNMPIYLVLDTPGGSVDAGFRLYEFLRQYPNVHTITIGSYSMGAVLVEMLPGKRMIVETGVIMFHRMAVAFPRHHNMDQIDARLRFFHAQEDMVVRKIAERTGIELGKMNKMIDEDLFLSASQALEQNFVDKIVGIKCTKDVINKKVTEVISGGGFLPDVEVERSACPLM